MAITRLECGTRRSSHKYMTDPHAFGIVGDPFTGPSHAPRQTDSDPGFGPPPGQGRGSEAFATDSHLTFADLHEVDSVADLPITSAGLLAFRSGRQRYCCLVRC